MSPILWILWILAALLGCKAERFTVIQKLSRTLAEAGQTVFLPCTCTASVSMIGSYSWYKDGRNGIKVSNETAEYRGRIYRHSEDFFHTGDASILMKDVRVNDSGVYYCQVQLMQLGEKYGAGTSLTVRGSNAEKFTVIQKEPRILAVEGQTVFLHCTYTANASNVIGYYSWYRNGIEVSNGTAEYTGRIYGDKEDFFHTGESSIQIKDVRVNDSGVYYCKVTILQLGEEYGTGTNLTVRGISADFRVIQKLPSIQAVEGESVLIPCTHTAYVSLGKESYNWYKNARNGTEVSNREAEYRGRIFWPKKEDFFNASIGIKEVRVNDFGMYYCSVKMRGLDKKYGTGTYLTVIEKTKSITTVLLILFISAAGEIGIFLIVALRYVQLRRKKDVQQVQREETDIPENTSTAASLNSSQLAGMQDLNQDGNLLESDPLCMDVNQEEQSIDTPMESEI
ncbi:protein turtle homolog B-like isoform X2 [Heterodontus francisci]|uniref:protein turtle homolog B-like isoform X2 n=1 Tax=Heterodontus francisci TaxID=7792 RepID=UPI00355BB9AD